MRLSYKMFSYLPLPSLRSHWVYSLKFLSFCKNTHIIQFLLPIYCYARGFPLEFNWLSMRYTLKDSWSPISQQLQIAISSLARNGMASSLLSILWTTTVSLYVRLPFCVQKILFLCRHLPLLLLTLSISFPSVSSGSGRRGCDTDVQFRATHFTLFCFLHIDQLVVSSVLITTYCREKAMRIGKGVDLWI